MQHFCLYITGIPDLVYSVGEKYRILSLLHARKLFKEITMKKEPYTATPFVTLLTYDRKREKPREIAF